MRATGAFIFSNNIDLWIICPQSLELYKRINNIIRIGYVMSLRVIFTGFCKASSDIFCDVYICVSDSAANGDD